MHIAGGNKLRKKGDKKQDHLRIEQIDASDGSPDGKRTQPAGKCRECDSMVPSGLPSCQFCGTELPNDSIDPFDGV